MAQPSMSGPYYVLGYKELCKTCLFVPMAQTSTGGPYCVSPTSSSGALYHLVATYSVYSPPGPAVGKYNVEIVIEANDDTALMCLNSCWSLQTHTHAYTIIIISHWILINFGVLPITVRVKLQIRCTYSCMVWLIWALTEHPGKAKVTELDDAIFAD